MIRAKGVGRISWGPREEIDDGIKIVMVVCIGAYVTSFENTIVSTELYRIFHIRRQNDKMICTAIFCVCHRWTPGSFLAPGSRL